MSQGRTICLRAAIRGASGEGKAGGAEALEGRRKRGILAPGYTT